MKYWSKRDLLFLIPAFLLLLGGGWDLKRNWSGRSGIGKNEEIGTIVYKVKVAERLFQGEKLWNPVFQNGPVYNFDTIRTESGSSAVITLTDGTEILIDELTMVILSRREDGAEIRLESGDLTIRSGESEEVTVLSGDSVLSVKKGSAGFARKGSVTDVSVDRGQVEWSRAGKKTTLSSDQGSWRVGEAADAAPEAVMRPVRITAPLKRSRLAVPPGQNAVTLTWTAAETALPLRLEISRKRSFADPVIVMETREPEETVFLEPGQWFWRLAAADGTAGDDSSFVLVADDPPRPTAGLFLPVKADPSTGLIPLSWTPADNAMGYRVEIARDEEFTDILQEVGTDVPNLMIPADTLPQGEYHYRVSAVYPLSEKPLTGPSGRILVGKAVASDNPPPGIPVLQRQRQGSTEALRNGRMVLSWDALSRAESYEVTFFDSEGEAVRKETVPESRITVPELASGEYTWRVRSQTGGQWSELSDEGFITIREPLPPVLKSPGNEALLSLSTAVRFSWNDPENGPSVILEVDDSDRFDSPEIRNELKGKSWTAGTGTLKAGTWYWRVRTVSVNGGRERVSETRTFVLPVLIGKPVLRSPGQGQVIDVYSVEAIDFVWTPVEGADSYELSVVKSSSGMESELFSVTVDEPEYRFTSFEVLALDRFQWVVIAVGRDGLQIRRSEPARGTFRLMQSETPDAVRLKIPEVIFR